MKHNTRIWTLLATLAATHTPATLMAAPLDLAQSPPGAGREPAPNIIVSVDDSGSMGTTGMSTLKSALNQTFSAANVADGRVRLAWQSMNTCRNISTNGNTATGCGSFNGMRSLEGVHRTNFLNWVNTTLPSSPPNSNLTPSHQMMQRSGEYLRSTGTWSPWRSNPGVASDTTEMSCRKSFNIFMTDGAWNTFQESPYTDGSGIVVGVGNVDGTSKLLKDGTLYDVSPSNTQTRIYRDSWGSSQLSTLSDLAFHYWSTDLQNQLADNVTFKPKVTGNEAVGNGTVLTPYWNPKNNPARWQHMVTYTIGFNTQATRWTGNPVWSGEMFGGDGYTALANGTTSWVSPLCSTAPGNPDNIGGNALCANPNKWNARSNYRSSELWHMALNSRGRFVPAPNAQTLVTAFKGILDEILEASSNPLVSIASSTSRLRTNGYLYVAGFDSEGWRGELSAYAISAGTHAVAATPSWNASSLMDASTFSTSNRLVLTHNGTEGIPFLWANLPDADKTALRGPDSATVGENRVNYLRGVRTLEVANGGTMRNRKSRLGDIVNSNIWHTAKPLRMGVDHAGHKAFRDSTNALNNNNGRTPALYVGANDGMLHAFNASNGRELFAYVPKAMYATLRDHTLTSYTHKYYVDGHPFTGDAMTSENTWRTVLVSGLGGGGRGYFVLDVTNPASVNAASVMIDKTVPANTPDTDTTKDEVEDDIGHIYAQPVLDSVTGSRSEQIVKLNNGRWAVVMGNGVNSVNERPVLLIQYLDAPRELARIVASATKGGANGLSAPRLIDVNGDGTMDIAYAGDLLGNLWKFNLLSKTSSDWGVSSWSNTPGAATCQTNGASPTVCTPFAVAKDSTGTRQSITAPPLWVTHPVGGIQLLFGTGRNLTAADRSDANTQTIYSVRDKSTYETVTPEAPAKPYLRTQSEGGANITDNNPRTNLVQQTVVNPVGNTNYFNTSDNAVDYRAPANKRGWYFDLPASRERVLVSPQFFEGQKAIIGSTVPTMGSTGESCDLTTTAEDNWINVLNIITGKPSSTPVWASEDGSLAKATRTRFGAGEFVTINNTGGGVDLISFKNHSASCPAGTLCTEKLKLNPSLVPGARADWREIR